MANAIDSLVASIERNRLRFIERNGKHQIETPWGPSQSCDEVAPGIWSIDTASHGGYRLSPDRQAAFAKRFPGYVPFGGSLQWFEEDCEAAMIPVAFPDCFPAESVERATKFVRMYRPELKL